MNISTLQADARAKFKTTFAPALNLLKEAGHPEDDFIDQFLDEIILSTVRAVLEEVVPRPRRMSESEWNDAIEEVLRRFDSLLGCDAK